MLRFRSVAEAEGAALAEPVAGLVRRQMAAIVAAFEETGAGFDPERDGELVLFQSAAEADAPLSAFGWEESLPDLLPEWVDHDAEADAWIICVIPTDNWGLTFILPNFSDLPERVRAFISRELADSP